MHFDIHQLETTQSTNDDVRKASQEGFPEGLVIWALSQSAGRGRQDRRWESPLGNLYFSVLLRPPIAQRDYGFYSFISALAVSDALSTYVFHGKVEIKWPNDVLVDGKKISGILLEAGDSCLIIGIGVNISHMPEHTLYPATSLVQETRDVPLLENVLGKILQALSTWCEIFDTTGFTEIRKAWLQRARKGPLRIRTAEGDIHGDFHDLDHEGNLSLILPDGRTLRFRTGDVFFS